MSPTELAWAAGFFDGEGYVGITPTHFVDVVIVQVDPRPLALLQQEFGGSITARRRMQSPRHRQTYSWHIRSHAAVAFLNAVLPYLVVKRGEADIALAFQASKGRPHLRISEWQRAEQASYRAALIDAHHLEWAA